MAYLTTNNYYNLKIQIIWKFVSINEIEINMIQYQTTALWCIQIFDIVSGNFSL
jgi:hypothetical protein